MKNLPLLKNLREAQSLSQRALAEKSGVAHDTIGQLERGERLARPTTIHKLGSALNVEPFVLTLNLEEAVSLVEAVETRRMSIMGEYQLDGLLSYLTQIGILEEDGVAYIDQVINPTYIDSMSSASFDDVIDAVNRASWKLEPFDALNSKKGDLVEGVEAAVLLARSSSRLVQLLADQLEAGSHDRPSSVPKLGELGRSLVDAWLEGATAAKRLLDVADKSEEFARRVQAIRPQKAEADEKKGGHG